MKLFNRIEFQENRVPTVVLRQHPPQDPFSYHISHFQTPINLKNPNTMRHVSLPTKFLAKSYTEGKTLWNLKKNSKYFSRICGIAQRYLLSHTIVLRAEAGIAAFLKGFRCKHLNYTVYRD